MTHQVDDPLDAGFMQLAVDASSDALRAGNMPFGAVLVQGGQVLQVSFNQRRTAIILPARRPCRSLRSAPPAVRPPGAARRRGG